MASSKAKSKKSFQLKVDIVSIAIVILAIIFGFLGGMYYSHYMNDVSTNPTTTYITPYTHICNCPDMRVGQTPSVACHC